MKKYARLHTFWSLCKSQVLWDFLKMETNIQPFYSNKIFLDLKGVLCQLMNFENHGTVQLELSPTRLSTVQGIPFQF